MGHSVRTYVKLLEPATWYVQRFWERSQVPLLIPLAHSIHSNVTSLSLWKYSRLACLWLRTLIHIPPLSGELFQLGLIASSSTCAAMHRFSNAHERRLVKCFCFLFVVRGSVPWPWK